MERLQESLNRPRMRLVMVLVVVGIAAIVYCWNLNALPLTDYDEATYAQVTRDTFNSGNTLTLKRFDANWFEKPPLYFWAAMGTTSFFGGTEFGYRLPSVLLAIVGIALLWLLVFRLTRDVLGATLAALVLIASAFYYIAARQVRLDIPAITCITGSLVAFVYGWEKKQWLLAIAPVIAVGFLFKSFVAMLAVPLIIILSIAFKKYSWLRDPFFWIGAGIALAVLIPWHWYEYYLWDDAFVKSYFGQQVFERYSAGIAENASLDPMGYIKLLFRHGQPWVSVFIVSSAYGIWVYGKERGNAALQLLIACLVGSIVIFTLFAFSRTKILTYMLPLFPLMAVVIGIAFTDLMKRFNRRWVQYGMLAVFIVLLFVSYRLASGIDPVTLSTMHYEFAVEEKKIGEVIAKDERETNVYLLEWPVHETIRFYSGREVQQLPFPPEQGTILKAPWYLMFTNQHVPFFTDAEGHFKEQYRNGTLEYRTDKIFLIHSEEDLELKN